MLNPDVINLVTIKPQYLTLWGLLDYIDYLEQNDQNSFLYQQAVWSKIANPFVIIIMIILAIPFVHSHSRTTAIGQRVFVGCLIGIIFHLLNQIAGQLGVVYTIHPMISATVPLLLLASVTLWLMRRHT